MKEGPWIGVADGKTVALLRSNELSFTLGERAFTIKNQGSLDPSYDLWLGNDLMVSAKPVPLLKRYTVTYSGNQWTLKAMGLLEKKYGLYRNGEQVGRVLPTHPFLNPYKDVLIDLPDELPLEAKIFLMWMILRILPP